MDDAPKDSGNPYARIDPDIEERLPQPHDAQTHSGTMPLPFSEPAPSARPAHPPTALLHKQTSGHPYASIQYEDDEEAGERKPMRGISMADFEARCRAVFRPYMPAWMRAGALHAHYREFISRSRGRSPAIRERIVTELEKYAINDIPGLATQFNREQEALTVAKLKRIEQSAADE